MPISPPRIELVCLGEETLLSLRIRPPTSSPLFQARCFVDNSAALNDGCEGPLASPAPSRLTSVTIVPDILCCELPAATRAGKESRFFCILPRHRNLEFNISRYQCKAGPSHLPPLSIPSRRNASAIPPSAEDIISGFLPPDKPRANQQPEGSNSFRVGRCES